LEVEPPEPFEFDPPDPLEFEPPEPFELLEPPEPDGFAGSFMEPVQPITIVAAKIVLQLFIAHLIGACRGGKTGGQGQPVGGKSWARYPTRKDPGKTFVIEKMSFLLPI
jgi:hypothetical protein